MDKARMRERERGREREREREGEGEGEGESRRDVISGRDAFRGREQHMEHGKQRCAQDGVGCANEATEEESRRDGGAERYVVRGKTRYILPARRIFLLPCGERIHCMWCVFLLESGLDSLLLFYIYLSLALALALSQSLREWQRYNDTTSV